MHCRAWEGECHQLYPAVSPWTIMPTCWVGCAHWHHSGVTVTGEPVALGLDFRHDTWGSPSLHRREHIPGTRTFSLQWPAANKETHSWSKMLKMNGCWGLTPRCHIYVNPSPKIQGTLWKKEQKEKKKQRVQRVLWNMGFLSMIWPLYSWIHSSLGSLHETYRK